MSTPKKIGCLVVFAILFIPFIRFQNRVDVDVNWSIQEAAPTNHTVTIQNLSFTVPAGRSVKQALELKGGGTSAALYTIRGWGFVGQHLRVDGREIPLNQIRRANSRGELRILGIGRSAAMDATIVL
jgi:hypothetical protein